jgi:hypothetical protein
LFTTLTEEERPLAKKLILHLFDSGRQSERTYDVRRAQTAHGLIKLLYGGTSSLSFSAKDAVSFLHGKRRSEILNDIVSGGALLQWIYFLSNITDTADIKDAPGIAESLLNAAKQEPANTWESVHRLVAEYLAEVFEKLPTQKERMRLLTAVASQRKNLFITEHFLVKLASDAGLWKNGQSFSLSDQQSPSKPDLVPPTNIVDAQQSWLKNVRAAAADGALHNHPHLGSILHRWGQFNNNDYKEVQCYFSAFSKTDDPLLILSHFALGVSLDGLDKIVSEPVATKIALLRRQTHQELRATAVRVMDHLQKLSKQSQTLGAGQSA